MMQPLIEKHCHLLIVEDDATTRLLLRAFLRGYAAQVSEAASAAEAMESITTTAPDVILLDHHLPDQDGIELLKGLRASGFSGAIVVITGFNESELVLDYWRAGADDFLSKVPALTRAAVIDAIRRVTHRVASARALRAAVQRAARAQQRLIGALDALEDGIAFFRPTLDGSLHLDLGNQRFTDLYGDTGLRPALSSASAADDPDPAPALQHLPGDTWVRVTERRTPDGGVIHISSDVTELVRARQAADAANRAKSRFVGMVSHELKTPLSVILGLLDMLQDPDRFPDPATAAGYCRKSFDAAEHLTHLVEDLLDLTRIEAGRLTLRVQPLCPVALTREVMTQLEPLAADKMLSFRTEFADLPDDDRRQIIADPQRLRQVLWNLIGNAVKFTERGEVVLSLAVDCDTLLLHVRDTGPGIPEKDRTRVFRAFEQTASGRRRADGTGLGLPITKALVEAHDGTLTLTDAPGGGALFTVRLPLTGPATPTPTAARAE